MLEAATSQAKLQIAEYSSPEDILISDEQRSIIFNQIAKLPIKQRTAFILSKYDQLPQKEIAAIMQISEGAVESLIQRAKTNLQKRLSKVLKHDNKHLTMKIILACW